VLYNQTEHGNPATEDHDHREGRDAMDNGFIDDLPLDVSKGVAATQQRNLESFK
jgi:hypothetical protein